MNNFNENIELTFTMFIKRIKISSYVYNKKRNIYEKIFPYNVELENCQNYGKAWIWALENLPPYRQYGNRWRAPISSIVPIRKLYFFENSQDATIFKLKWA